MASSDLFWREYMKRTTPLLITKIWMFPSRLDYNKRLHDYNLNEIEKRNDRRLFIGECFGYFGDSRWFYLYDKENVIQMRDLRIEMEEDKYILDNYRALGLTIQEVKKYCYV